MKTMMITLLVITSLVSCNNKKELLFNGENLDDWTIVLFDSTIQTNDYFYVNEGCIETVGVPVGYLRTKKKYSNYQLHVEWRYPDEPSNSGIFLHTHGDDKIWPNHYQAQLKHRNAGDFIVQGEGLSATLNDTIYTSNKEVKPLIPKMNECNERVAGEWNSYDIKCEGKTIEIRVNGLLQNVANNCSYNEGSIGLQAEGSKIQYRNIWIEPINSKP